MAELVPLWIDDLRAKRRPEPDEPTIGEIGEYRTIRLVPSGTYIPPMTDKEFADAFAEVMGDE
jgi:hypothetical protein